MTPEKEAAVWYDLIFFCKWYYLDIEPYYMQTWEEIKSSFLEADQRGNLQGDDKYVRSYFLWLQRVLNRWPGHGIPNNLVKEVFVDGQRSEYRDWIALQEPDLLEESLKFSFIWEKVRGIRMDRKEDLKCKFCNYGKHKEKD